MGGKDRHRRISCGLWVLNDYHAARVLNFDGSRSTIGSGTGKYDGNETFVISPSSTRQQQVNRRFGPIVMISLEVYVPIENFDVPVRGHNINRATLQFGWLGSLTTMTGNVLRLRGLNQAGWGAVDRGVALRQAALEMTWEVC